MTQPEELYCTDCGSTNILSEAYCSWDTIAQKYAYFEVTDEGWDSCADCGHDAAMFRPVTDVKTLAQLAINKQEELQ